MCVTRQPVTNVSLFTFPRHLNAVAAFVFHSPGSNKDNMSVVPVSFADILSSVSHCNGFINS